MTIQKTKPKREAHPANLCDRAVPLGAPENLTYCGRSYRARFRCPICGRTVWQNLNYLGQRLLVCEGTRFSYR